MALHGLVGRTRGRKAYDSLILAGKEIPTECTFTFSNSATQYGFCCEIALCNKDGVVIPGVHVLDVYLTDAADGAGITASGVATSAAAKSASGTVIGIMTSAKAFRVVTLATGKFTLEAIDDVSPNLLYVAASSPATGIVSVSRKTVAGDYKP